MHSARTSKDDEVNQSSLCLLAALMFVYNKDTP